MQHYFWISNCWWVHLELWRKAVTVSFMAHQVIQVSLDVEWSHFLHICIEDSLFSVGNRLLLDLQERVECLFSLKILVNDFNLMLGV